MSRKMTREQEKAMFARMNEGYVPKRNRSTKYRTGSTSRDIKTSEIKTSKYWEGDPERHSEAAKLGWELRGLGFKKVKDEQSIQEQRKGMPLPKAKGYRGPTLYQKPDYIRYEHYENEETGVNVSIVKQITDLVEGKNKYYIYKWGGGKPTRHIGPFDTKKDAKKALLTAIFGPFAFSNGIPILPSDLTDTSD